jgi:hypothetical protein
MKGRINTHTRRPNKRGTCSRSTYDGLELLRNGSLQARVVAAAQELFGLLVRCSVVHRSDGVGDPLARKLARQRSFQDEIRRALSDAEASKSVSKASTGLCRNVNDVKTDLESVGHLAATRLTPSQPPTGLEEVWPSC